MEMDFEINAEAIKKIAEAGFDPAFGARPLKRAIQSEIENPLAKKILAGDFHAKDKVVVGFSKEKFTFTKA
jgi:ATP-dependent Clp protease ATP-binding subunit ClpB